MRINEEMKISVLSLAVHSALAVMFAMPMLADAADASQTEAAALRRPSNFVEIGAEHVSKDSAKFGEYSGLSKSGAEIIGNFSVSGGDAYDGGDGTLRWEITGNDLGTTSRELGATVGNQGRWNLSIGHDELRHNITDTYQTPQQGNMGGNTFTLPATFGVYNGATTATTITVPPSTRAIPAGALHTEEVGTTRKNTSFGVGYNISPQLSVKFDYNHLAQSGAKLLASATLGGINTGVVGSTWRAEAIAVLMNPTNYKTDTFNLALNWVGDKGHLTGAYYGSIFRDGYDRMSWENPIVTAAGNTAPAGVYQTTTMSTAPDNQLHQLNLSGGYTFSPTTKLTGGLSYGRNTQNDSFLAGMPEIVLAPQASLNGRVITTHADLKLTNKTTKDLTLSATFKYNERDNKTPSNIYQYYAINNITAIDSAANAPYSNKKTEFELAGDYRLDKRQNIRLAYDYEKINRWCDNYALAANCLVSPSSTEDKLGIKYKLKANDKVSLNAGYAHANRKSTFDHNAITPLSGLDAASLTLVNAQDYPGFEAFTYASRKQDLLKAGVNWQANEKLELGIEGRYVNDNYGSTLGIQDSRTTGINLDAAYTFSDNASVSAYVSWQSSKKDMRIGAAPGAVVGAVGTNTGTSYAALVAPTNIWTNLLDEDSNSIGINTKHKLMGGKLELAGDLSYSLDKSRYSTQVPYLATCSLATSLTCGDLPDIKSKVTTLKVTGIYSLDKRSKISVGYMYQQLKSDDYQYNWFQLGYTGTRGMPTNQQAPNNSVNVVAVSYIYNFK